MTFDHLVSTPKSIMHYSQHFILNLWIIFFLKLCNLWIFFQNFLRFPSRLEGLILINNIKMSMYKCCNVLIFKQYNM